MGCNCGQAKRGASSRDATPPQNPRREGGPGEPGYYWTGPKRPPQPPQQKA